MEIQTGAEGNLRIRILSDAPGSEAFQANGMGMGLTLLQQRLDALFGAQEEGWIRWAVLGSGQFEVEITLPPSIE